MEVDGISIAHWSGKSYFPAEDTLLLLHSLKNGNGTFLDVGTGTGIIGIAARASGYEVTSTDIDFDSVREAERNAEENGAEIAFIVCNLLDCIHCSFDVIAFNPPYLPEGGVADRQLAGGPKGVELAAEFMEEAQGHLNEGGEVLLVLSSLGDLEWFRERFESRWTLVAEREVKLDFETLSLYKCTPRQSLKSVS